MEAIELATQDDASLSQWIARTVIEVNEEVELFIESGCSPDMIRTVLRHGGN